jgi:hypothetical protein
LSVASAATEDLGWFAGHHPQRRDVADGVAGEECREGLTDREPPMRRHAQAPRAGANQKARAGEPENGHEPPADLADTVEDFADAGTADGVAKEDQATHRRQNGQDVALHVMQNSEVKMPRLSNTVCILHLASCITRD